MYFGAATIAFDDALVGTVPENKVVAARIAFSGGDDNAGGIDDANIDGE